MIAGRGIIAAVAREYGFAREDLLSAARDTRLIEARQVAMFLARCTFRSYPEIGRLLNRDHSTVMHGVGQTAARYRNDPAFARHVNGIANRLNIEIPDYVLRVNVRPSKQPRPQFVTACPGCVRREAGAA